MIGLPTWAFPVMTKMHRTITITVYRLFSRSTKSSSSKWLRLFPYRSSDTIILSMTQSRLPNQTRSVVCCEQRSMHRNGSFCWLYFASNSLICVGGIVFFFSPSLSLAVSSVLVVFSRFSLSVCLRVSEELSTQSAGARRFVPSSFRFSCRVDSLAHEHASM